MLAFDRSGNYRSRFAKLGQKLLKTAGVQERWFPDIRRTASTVLYQTTENVYAAKDVLGRSSVDVTERCLAASEERRQEAVDALASGRNIGQILELELAAHP